MSEENKTPSKAPAPIIPLSGKGGHFPAWRPAKKPNWKEWAYTPKVRLWQACALSLDIEPHPMKQIRNPWMVPGHGPFFGDDSFPSDAVKKDFELRQRVLLANLSNPAFFSPGILDMSTPGNHEVPLHEFAAWCVDTMIHWGIPQELAALAKGVPQAAPVVTVKAVQVTSPSNNAWEDRAREIADKVALKKWDSGIREITARNICDAVATELAKETKNHGNRGPRSSGSVRSKGLKGWKFILPAGTNGTSGTKE